MSKRKRRMNWFYVPALILLAMFVVYPFAQAFQLSFMKWNGYSVKKTFVGLSNYAKLLTDENVIANLK